jgi:hypothetical protein
MKAATKQKLEEFAQFIETINPNKFNMSAWLNIKDNYKFFQTKEVDERDGFVGKDFIGKCGTACCLAGWEVARQGFLLNEDGTVATEVKIPGIKKPVVIELKVDDANVDAPAFAKTSLGLTEQEEELLFYPSQWPVDENTNSLFENTPKGAAARIRYLIKTGK